MALRIVLPLVRVDERVAERDQVWRTVAREVLVKVGFELRVGWRFYVDEILHQKLELLRQPSPYDRVVLVEPHRQGLPVERRFPDVFLGKTG